MSLRPLPQALITAHKLRQQTKKLILLAEKLEASIPRQSLQRKHSLETIDVLGGIIPRAPK